VESLLEAGRDLIAAKKALGHGQFGSLFTSGLVRLSQRSAEMLMRVAGHDALSNPNNYSILPKSIHSLNNLAALEAPVIEQAIIAREISPGMTIADTRSLVRRKQGYAAVRASESTPTPSANPMELDSLSATKSAANPMSAAFDVHAFKTTLRQMLERECAKHPRRVGEIQRTATAICSELFQSRPVTSTASIQKPNSHSASSAISVESRAVEQERVLATGPTSPTSKPAARTSPAPTETPPRPKTMSLKQRIAQNSR
jgi:hypothetical protein